MRTAILPLLLLLPLVACRRTAAEDDASTTASMQSAPQDEAPEPVAEPGPELGPRERDARGDEHLKAGRFDAAIADFDGFLAANPELAPHHWRRGIALYYAGRYADGIAQFESHRGVNPADVENATWHYICKARLASPAAARAALLPVQPDGRVPMMTIYELYAGRATSEDVLQAAGESPSGLFYAHLYLGLFAEAAGDSAAARQHIDLAAGRYGHDHYMGDVARAHAALLVRREK